MAMPLPQRLSFAPLTTPAELVPAAQVLTGHPQTRYASAHATPDGHFDVGLWEGTAGSWQVSYTETEVCLLLSGRVRLSPAQGTVQEFTAGEAFLVPAGFNGVWEVLEDARKLYVIYQP